LQHQDGQSHVLALSVPNLRAYDPTFAYEIAVIIKNGLSRMYVEGENIFFYITVMNEFYKMPSMPEKSEEGIIKGLYKLKASENVKSDNKVNLLGSGAILLQAMEAAHILEDKYGIATDVWSATSFKELYRDAVATERYNRLQPDEKLKIPYITQCFSGKDGVFVAVSDYLKALPLSLGSWIPGKYIVLGTDGFGRSDSRSALRDFFEVDSRHIVLAALSGLSSEKKITKEQVKKAINDLDIDPGKLDPAIS
jgi:pyruvate dehydrogenase E1 component